MAKNNVISDFRALKGKVSFSESKPVVRSDAEKKSDVSERPQEKVLRVGQKVVLMDSDLRGKIVSLGKTVAGIELEDGLVIRSAYNEFAVTDDSEISALKQTKVKAKKTSHVAHRTTYSSPSGILSVDLHIEAIPGGCSVPKGQQLDFQMEVFKKTIRDNMCHKGMKISFIHGVGDGILKAAVRKELDEVLALRCTYSVGDPAVTLVTIK